MILYNKNIIWYVRPWSFQKIIELTLIHLFTKVSLDVLQIVNYKTTESNMQSVTKINVKEFQKGIWQMSRICDLKSQGLEEKCIQRW